MRILLTGGSGMVGSAIKKLLDQDKSFIISAPTSKQLNLLEARAVHRYFQEFQPEMLIHCAARVGGVWSNARYPATFSLENLTIQSNIANAIVNYQVQRTINISSSCIYPKSAPIPLSTESLMTGPLEETNKWYAMAKLSMLSSLEGIELEHGLKSVSILPANVYGPNDNFHIVDGHVVASLLIRALETEINETTSFSVWGTGKAMRELIYVDDLARAVCVVLSNFDSFNKIINVGSGEELSIYAIAQRILQTVGREVEIKFDESMPDGVLRKPLDSQEIRSFGWSPQVSFSTGIELTHDWVVDNIDKLRRNSVRNE